MELISLFRKLRNSIRKKRPFISVIVAFHDMEREAPRTLYSLSAKYQKRVTDSEYEVIAVDCGSKIPMKESLVTSFGPQFRLLRFDPAPSPAASINTASKQAKGDTIMICIDGARILSPGILDLTISAMRAYHDPIIATIAFHLGEHVQNRSILEGYDQSVEDKLLASVDWQKDGYELYKIASLALSSRRGWTANPTESNCIAMHRDKFRLIGGLDERFKLPGGGLVNPYFFLLACSLPGNRVLLLGEATFHQIHGGVATNVPMEKHPGKLFNAEYMQITGAGFEFPYLQFNFHGKLPVQAMRFHKMPVND